jgi:formylglycine-generating enzyme required for sulfatase activity
LPREAEWEFACRGGATSEEECSYHFYLAKPTNDLSSTDANFDGFFPFGKAAKGPYLKRTTKVGSYAPNKLGLHDMHGNVSEWCEDLWVETDVDQKLRMFRGGHWNTSGNYCATIMRGKWEPTFSSLDIGFRLARTSVR